MDMQKTKGKIYAKLEKVFNTMACKDPKKAVHKTALAAAMIVAVLPVGIDAWALRISEIMMLMSVYAHYGKKLTDSAAESLLTSAFAQTVGEAAAYASLEACDAAAILNPLAVYGIKLGIAVGLIEAIGWASVQYLEGCKAAKIAVRTMQAVGALADAERVIDYVPNTSAPTEHIMHTESTGVLSFTGNVDADLTAKIDEARRKVKQYKEYLESDIRFDRDMTSNQNSLKYWEAKLTELLRKAR